MGDAKSFSLPACGRKPTDALPRRPSLAAFRLSLQTGEDCPKRLARAASWLILTAQSMNGRQPYENLWHDDELYRAMSAAATAYSIALK